MIVNLRFGYKNRHQVYFDTELKRGSIKLWSADKGTTGDDEGALSGLFARQESHIGGLLDGNQYTEFLIEEEKDILLILASLIAATKGKIFSFSSKEGRKITFAMEKETKQENNAIVAHIQYSKPGRLTVGEVHKLQTIVKHILFNMGYSEQEILKGIKNSVRDILK